MGEKNKRGQLNVDTEADWKKIVYIMPKGHKAIGVVRQGAAAPGVLALVEKSGEYVQLNELGTRTLDQRKVRAALGIPNAVGRPRTSYEPREVYSVRLDESLAAYLRELGGGNLSAGIMQIAAEHRDRAERRASTDD